MQLSGENLESAQPVRILLVDDQKDVLHVMQLVLTRQYNYCVEIASSGQQALKKAETFSPDIVISDLSMPEIDGCELMMQLREKPSLNSFKSIALSGYGGEQQEASKAAGYDVHLVKPVDYDNLTKVIDQLAQEKVNVSQ